MTKKELMKLLGLPEDAGDVDVTAKITAMSEADSKFSKVRSTLGVKDDATMEQILEASVAKVTKAEPSKVPGTVTLSESDWKAHQKMLNDLNEKSKNQEADLALGDLYKKITPAQRDKFKKLYMADKELFTEITGSLPDLDLAEEYGHGGRRAPAVRGQRGVQALSDEIDTEVTKLLSESKDLDYATALSKVFVKRPDLARAYTSDMEEK